MSKRKRRIPTSLHTPLYLAIRGLLGTMLMGDLSGNLRTARTLAQRYARVERSRFKRTMDTLGVAFPEMPDDQRRAQALKAYEHLFMLGVEMAYTPRVLTPDNWHEHVRLGDLKGAAKLLLSGKPAVMITGHCGNWELLGYALALLGFPMNALYRPLDLKPLDRWLRSTRQKRGLRLLDKFGAADEMPRLMDAGELVAFIADQNAGDRGLFVPFFGRLASTYKSIGLMALQFEAPIICGQARRLIPERDLTSAEGFTDIAASTSDVGFRTYSGEPMRYQIDVLDVIYPEDWASQPDPLFYVSARYRRALEEMIRRAPEQNLWLHRYWKSRPRHEHMGKPLPASLKNKLWTLPWMTQAEIDRIEDWTKRDAATLAEKAAASGAHARV